MLTIWGRENSNNVRKVLWCAAELGLSYTHINAGGAFGKVNEESYRALNPNGPVPLLQDDDFVLWESNTIVRYRRRNSAMRRSIRKICSARRRREMDGLDHLDHRSGLHHRLWGLIRTAPELRDMAKIEAAIATLEKHFDVIEQALAHQPYLRYDAPTFSSLPSRSSVSRYR